MKSSFVVAGLVIGIPVAHALVNFDSSELDLTNTAGITYDSNLSGGPKGKEDTFVNYSPRLDFIRKAGLIELQSNLGVNFTRYFDQTNLDAQDVNAGLRLNLAEAIRGAFTGSVDLSYIETATVLEEVNTRVHSDTLSFGASGQALLGRRITLTAGANYSNARRSGGSNSDSVGANVGWALSDFLRGTSLHLNYVYNYTHSDAGPFSPISVDQSSHQITTGLSRLLFPNGQTTISADFGYRFLDRSDAERKAGLTGDGGYVFNVGISGPFLPRDRFPNLKSSLALSYSQSATPGLNDDNTRGLQGSVGLDWKARERTNLGVSAHQSRSLTVSNLTATSSGVDFHVDQTFWFNVTANAGVGYTWSTYKSPQVTVAPGSSVGTFYTTSVLGQARSDEALSFTTGLTYAFARVWNAALRYEYRAVFSSLGAGDYDHHVVNLNVSCRF